MSEAALSDSQPTAEPPKKRYSGSFLALAKPELANRILRGRPSKIDEPTIREIVEAVEAGSPLAPACIAAGIAPDTANRWIQKGNEHLEAGKRSDYAVFVEMLTRATAKGQTTHAKYLATNEDWRARAFILERRYSDWRKQDVAQNVTNVVISDALVTQLSDAMRVAGSPSLALPPAIDVTATALPAPNTEPSPKVTRKPTKTRTTKPKSA